MNIQNIDEEKEYDDDVFDDNEDEEGSEGITIKPKSPIKKRVTRKAKTFFPILRWLPNYQLKNLSSDTIAGITVGFMIIPQSMAYAAIAGLSPQYGLYSSYIGCFLYVLLGNSAQMSVGPVSLVSFMSFETCGDNFPQCAVLVGFYAGIMEILLVVFRLGWVVSFISEPVVVGFTAGAALTTISSQIKNFFGMSGEKGSKFIDLWTYIFRDYETTSSHDALFGASSILAIFILKKLGEIDTKKKNFWTKSLKFISISRNIIVLLFSSIAALIFEPDIHLTGNVPGGFPPIDLPVFTLTNSNATILDEGAIDLDFFESISYLSTGAFVIAILSILESLSVLKGYDRKEGTQVSQEIFALGVCNVVGSLFSSMPICGSFSRSAVNNSSGVKTPLNGIFTGALVVISIQFLTPLFYYIPKASLAAVIIMALLSLIRYNDILPMWRISKVDTFICLITFAASLYFGMEYGIGIGSGLNLIILNFRITCPPIKVDEEDEIMRVNPSPLSYPAFDHFIEFVGKLKKDKKIVVDMTRCEKVDFSIALGMHSLISTGNNIRFTNCTKKAKASLINAGIPENCFIDITNITLTSLPSPDIVLNPRVRRSSFAFPAFPPEIQTRIPEYIRELRRPSKVIEE